ncbi:S-methyl-5-thioribose-1-phosphate isomerase [Rhizobiales bacterium TNE-4]|nr:S-methyl-5-thioribose-1-phosphate isomerase [Rhizobiales bacterium TNE-4]MBV1826902.1 S-methyl-5-thioribose-1-phosphate isomerase [Rhizobiales bacterium TNE-4]
MSVATMRFEDGVLHLIDQRVLPLAFETVSCRNAVETADAIRSMVVRGAPAIGCAAAFGLALDAQSAAGQMRPIFDTTLDQAFAVLAASRPTAVNLFWALERMRGVWTSQSTLPSDEMAVALVREAQAIYDEDIAANRAMGAHGAALLPQEACVLTHCNAGALATAGHGTALGVIRSAVEAGKNISVIADETRPFLQGARLTAWEMVQEQIPVTLISDNMAGHMMKSGAVDAVIVGADRIAANGDVANKIGTYMVAVLAARHQIPFYVAAPLSTFDLNAADGDAIPIEERAADEVTGFRDVRWAPEGVRVANPAFDVTPAELIAAIITEQGVIARPDRNKVAAHCRAAPMNNQ